MADYAHLFRVPSHGVAKDEPSVREQLEEQGRAHLASAEDCLRCNETDYFQGLRKRLATDVERLMDELKGVDAEKLGRVQALRELARSIEADVESARRILDGTQS